MSNLSQFLGGGGGGLTPKFQEFNSSGTFTPTQELIDAGGYIEVFLVGAGGHTSNQGIGSAGGEAFIKNMSLSNTSGVSVTVGAAPTLFSYGNGGNSVFNGSSAGGQNITALGGLQNGTQIQRLGAGWSNSGSNAGSAANGIFGYGAGGSRQFESMGIETAKANSGQGSAFDRAAGSGYCLVKWFE